jgi:hypothetical protein
MENSPNNKDLLSHGTVTTFINDQYLLLNQKSFSKVKAKLYLCLTKYHTMQTCPVIKHHVMKIYGESGGIAPRIPDLGTRERCVASFTSQQFTPKERAPGTHGMGGWILPM